MELSLAVLLVEPVAFAAGLAVLRLPVPVVRRFRLAVLAVLALASALGAVGAGASATGWVPFDVVLLAGAGVAGVLAGSHAPSPVILVAGFVAVVAGMDSVAAPLALAAIGLVLVSLLVETEPLVDAAAGGLITQAALRLTHPTGRGLTAVVAGGILLVLVVAAARTLDHPLRRTLKRLVLGTVAVAAVGAVVGAAAAALSAGPLRRGLSAATATIDATSSLDVDTTARGLSEAAEDFHQARQALEAWWAMPARAVPVVAQHWRALHAAALTGDQLAAAGHRALSAPALQDVQLTGGQLPLDELMAVAPSVVDVASRATAARERLDAARSPWLVPPLYDELESRLQRVRDIENTTQLASRVMPMVPRLFGRDGPRRYFLAVQTPVEARAGGGFMGNYGEITADNGRVSLSRFGRQDDLTRSPGSEQRKLEGPEEYVARYGRFHPEAHWANVNLSPDFPTDAQVMANLYPQSGGAPIDGVIAVDPDALAALLAVVGPVEVPSWPYPINGANARQILLYDQYAQEESRDQRIDFLGDVAQMAWQRLTTGELPPVPQLLAALGPTVRGKHMFFFSTRPDEQRLFEDMGAAGEVAPVVGDFIGLVTQNASGNKVDYFLKREVDYRAQVDPGSGRLEATVTVELHNEAPSAGISRAFLGSELLPPPPPGENRLYFSFYTPWDLVEAKVNGSPVQLERATELGRRVYSSGLIIPAKSTATVELRLSGRLDDSERYRLDVHRQPVVTPDEVTTTVVVPSGWQTPSGGTEQTSTMRLESDATVEVPLRRR